MTIHRAIDSHFRRCNSFANWVVLAIASVGFTASSASPKQTRIAPQATALVWPSPPDPPRIRYIKSISSPADIGLGRSTWKRAFSFITGDNHERQNLVKPFGIALDETGNLCLTDTGNSTVCYCDLVRKEWRCYKGVDKTRFASPVAVARKRGVFYVADSELGKVLAFDDNGRVVLVISTPLQRPAGLTVAGESLVVADSLVHAVFVFDLQGQLRFQFGSRGEGPGQFNFPTHVATDSAGHLLVTDSVNSRIQVFDSAGKFISQIGSAGDASGHFGRPKGVAADTFNHIYVVDAVYDNIQIFDLSGQLLLSWGESGTSPGQFGVPGGIAIGLDNQIYVADCYNRRVQVFKYVGQQ